MKIRTLLAVTLATAAPAAAGPEHDHGHKPAATAKAGPASATSPTVAPASKAAATPRTLPTGAPPCGNVQAKGAASQREVRDACLRAEAAKAAKVAATALSAPGARPAATSAPGGAPTTAVAARPRTLPTGSPACGNVQAKMPAQKRAEIEACLRAEAANAPAAQVKK